MYRTHNCGQLRLTNQGQQVHLCGWIQTLRLLGNLTFIDVRDYHGLTQLIVSQSVLAELGESLGREYVIQAVGTVIPRKSKNPAMPTGDIEVEVSQLTILNAAQTPPFKIANQTDGGEELRMKYRYLDLRRDQLQQNLKLRQQVAMLMRNYLYETGFNEIETPFLIKSTPEGARDFVIPSRMNPHQYYALPQSPQTFKQLLMVAGYDRYYQIVRCFRDEDLRADRQPEFTQLDCEMSFVHQEDIFSVFEGLITHILQEVKGIRINKPIKRITYEEALRDYGTDKPDLRFDMKIKNLKVKNKSAINAIAETEFLVFAEAASILGLVVEGGASYTRKDIDQMTDWVKRPQIGMKGLAYIKYGADKITSSIGKFFAESDIQSIVDYCNMKTGDMLFLLAGPEMLTRKAAGELRLEIARKQNYLDDQHFSLLWVTDFPLFLQNEDNQQLDASHHPFTAPALEDVSKLFNPDEYANIKSQAYDMVINGVEIGGGSIRIHKRDIQEKIFQILKLTPDEIKTKFGFILDAFNYGAPPHGGIAFGFDRICALLAGTDSIRDVIAFPKNNNGRDIMLDAPASIDKSQLDELHLTPKTYLIDMNLPIDVNIPLAERIRPQQLDDIWGQDHLVGKNGAIKKLLEQGRIVSAILWGRPGTGKTTLARLIAKRINHICVELSAAVVGVSDIRQVIAQVAKERVLLFLDEIHRFNKNQQDILLPAVESGNIVLIGATTENPSFEVNKALLSRLQVFEIKSLDEKAMLAILSRALEVDELLQTKTVTLKSTRQLIHYANGDARKMLGIIDMIIKTSATDTIVVDDVLVSDLLQQKILQYDKTGDDHYDTISAFIKSIRGSDPNAALYWFARMLVAGEDILFIARRLVILASEDIGLANPNALVLANATFDSVHKIGMPEARIILSNCIIYLACSEKSNAAYLAINKAIKLANQHTQHPVPLHLRNAPTRLMKDMGFGKNYQYDHDYQNHFSQQEFFPEEMAGTQLYIPQQNARENQLKNFLDKRWGDKYQSK